MVYVDNFYTTGAGKFGRMKMSHLIADTHKELIAMVEKIGVNPKWIQDAGTLDEHFDIAMSKRELAISNGCKAIHYRESPVIRKNRTIDNYFQHLNN